MDDEFLLLASGKSEGKNALVFSRETLMEKGICLNSLTPFNSLTPKK